MYGGMGGGMMGGMGGPAPVQPGGSMHGAGGLSPELLAMIQSDPMLLMEWLMSQQPGQGMMPPGGMPMGDPMAGGMGGNPMLEAMMMGAGGGGLPPSPRFDSNSMLG